MKQISKVLAVLLAAVMLFSSSVVAFAEKPEADTIVNAGGQIASLDLSELRVRFLDFKNNIIGAFEEGQKVLFPSSYKDGDNTITIFDKNFHYFQWEQVQSDVGEVIYQLKKLVDNAGQNIEKQAHIPKKPVSENVQKATCEADGSYDEVIYCAICEAEISRETKNIPALGHKYKLVEAQPSTCTEPGHEAYYQCTQCNQLSSDAEGKTIITEPVSIPINIDNHSWGEWRTTIEPTCEKDGEQTRFCQYNNSHSQTRKVNPLGHSWGEWEVTEEATCTAKGAESRICSHDSSHIETREIPIDVNRHNYVPSVTLPTCTEQGYTTYNCSRCKDFYIADYVDALGHDWGIWHLTKMPTCAEKGTLERVCKNDETHVESSSIDQLPHTPKKAVKEKEVLATCVKAGSYDEVTYCLVCNQEIKRVTKETAVAPNNHAYVDDHINMSTIRYNSKTKKYEAKIVKVCQNNKAHTTQGDYVALTVKVALNKDIYKVGEKWGSTVTIDYAYKGIKKQIKIAPTSKDFKLSGFSTKKAVVKMACTVNYGGVTYTLPNIMCVKERYIDCKSDDSTKWFYADSEDASYTSRVLVGKNGIRFKYGALLNSRKVTYSAKLKSNFNITSSYDKTTGYTTLKLVPNPNAAFLKAGNVSDYSITITGKDGKKTYTLKIIFNAAPNVKLTAMAKAFKVSWTATHFASGYEIAYSTSKNMSKSTTRKIKVSGENVIAKSISKLAKNKTYYVQMRSYYKVGKTTYYSDWSPVKGVKTK